MLDEIDPCSPNLVNFKVVNLVNSYSCSGMVPVMVKAPESSKCVSDVIWPISEGMLVLNGTSRESDESKTGWCER